jgi:hypothetical protein
MKKIVTTSGKFGPYESVEVLEDRYRVDGPSDLPFSVIGQGEISDVQDDDFPPPAFTAPVVEIAPAPTKEELLAEISALTAKIQAM